MAFSTVNNERAVFNCWRPPSRNWEQVQICWWWAVPLVRAVKNQACSWPCCSASLLTSGNAFYYECNVYIMHVIGNSYHFTTWTYGMAAHKRAHFHTCAHTCRQVLKQTEASTPFFPWHLLLMLIFLFLNSHLLYFYYLVLFFKSLLPATALRSILSRWSPLPFLLLMLFSPVCPSQSCWRAPLASLLLVDSAPSPGAFTNCLPSEVVASPTISTVI